MIEHLVIDDEPQLRGPTLIAAFAGWPDAGEVASGSMRYLLRKLRAKKFAAIDPEIFYAFTEVRPHTTLVGPYQREIRWPSNEFHYWRGADDLDLLLFLGREPNLRWKTYVGTFLALAEQCQVKRLITLGGTFDSVPHTGEPRVSGTAMDPSFRGALEGLAVRSSSYQGPTSIHSALLDACRQRGLASGSLWGHAPHYLQAAPNVKVCYGMLRKLSELLDLPVDLEEMRGAAHALELRVDRLLADNSELQEYVRQLEASEERSAEPPPPRGEPTEIPSPEAVVQDVEEFFRQEQQRRREEGDSPPP
jgi:proteasome assembly chaperone (PAC2) family protein